jgi:glutamyl/glutaminyl-tRNA synthetase
MIKAGSVYPCFCSENGAHITDGIHRCRYMSDDERDSRLSSGEIHCWRFKVASGRIFTYRDKLRGEISVPTDAIEDFSLARSDGSATYLLAVVADDHDYHITHVIRGEEHLSNVPKQEMIYRAMRWNVPEWIHIPMILDRDRHKLSKRSGAISISQYRKDGWSPEAIVSYLSSLSWSEAPTDRIVSMDELARMFDIASVAKFSPVHDEDRMTHFGKIFMSNVTDKELLDWCRDSFDPASNGLIPDDEKISLIRELLDSSATQRELAFSVRSELSWNRQVFGAGIPPWFAALNDSLAAIANDEWRALKIKEVMKEFAREKGLKARDLFHPVRILLTGSSRGAPIAIILSCVGREQSLKRFGYYLKREIS